MPNKKTCSNPRDSTIGTIKDIKVIRTIYYNNTEYVDTVNSNINIIYELPNHTMAESPISLESYLAEKPVCSNLSYLLLDKPPDTTNLQKFIIIYEEDNGNKYVDTTKAVYITP